MDLSKILSIAGKPGLYLMVGEAKNNLIVESLIDGKKIPSFAHDRVSTLKEISIYTENEDVPLDEVLKSIDNYTEGKPIENPKKSSSDVIKSTFAEILPDYDRDTVYVSDIKKIFSWYNLLLEKDMLDFTEEVEETDDTKGEHPEDVKKEEEQTEKSEDKN